MKKETVTFFIVVALSFGAAAQVKLGANPRTINANSILEMETSNKGILLPRVALAGTDVFTPLSAHIRGMTVYNTATANTGTAIAVSPGYYYNTGVQWVRILNQNDLDLRLLGSQNHITRDAGTGGIGISVGTGADNIGIGTNVFFANTSGWGNVAVGTDNLKASTTGITNVAIGFSNLIKSQTGSTNIGLGYQTFNNLTAGNNNIGIGFNAGLNVSAGSNNVAIGVNTNLANATQSNQLNISNMIFGTSLTGLVASPAGNIGIGTAAPATTLEIKSPTANTSGVRMTNLNSSTPVSAGAALGVNSTGDVVVVASPGNPFSNKQAITIGAITTAPTKATTKENDFIRFREIGNNQVEIDFLYSASSAAGASNGSGDYLITLPNGYSFNLTEHPLCTFAINSSATITRGFAFALRDMKTAFFGASDYSVAYIIPYTATQFRIVGDFNSGTSILGGASLPFSSTNWGLNVSNAIFGGRFTFVRN